MDFRLTAEQETLRAAVRGACGRFDSAYWQEVDRGRAYPEAFVRAMTEAGFLSALIPKDYGGLGLGITEASIILEEINGSGGSAAACHAQMYIMGALVRHGSEDQRRRWLPALASGKLRLQAFSVTEAEAGSDTTSITTSAVRDGDSYVINGRKSWTSRVEQSDLLLLLARTTPRDEVTRRTGGLSIFLIDLRDYRGSNHLIVESKQTMLNYATYQVTYRDLRIPATCLVGEEGAGFRSIIDGWNAERILLAAECIGDGRWFIERATAYANQREVFGRPIGQNQGVQFPLARSYAALTSADLLRYKAAWLFDNGEPCGAEANMAKLLASEASWAAANICLDTHGGNGFLVGYDVERKFRETRLYQVAPINNNLVLAYVGNHILDLPRSY